ncbi:phage tail protein [Streptomyces sp. AV19]|uniref:phage tail protein n=1 Tax=Streptomyces sp. AV19 TaxID=2793068 RepID=UPI0018FEFD9D|nr:phage tail protein [Streptomyces sp. AV19]MBH1939182.1 phage tail protein [Streptomyces sp. AV19]MDG4536912.1 phage tail protein [Streptomyces sp. AV19]
MAKVIEPGQISTSWKFDVTFDKISLTGFTRCEGLACVVEVEDYAEGGNNHVNRLFPKRLKYPPLTLYRPYTPLSVEIMSFLKDAVDNNSGFTGQIRLSDASDKALIDIKLNGVMPVSWAVSVLDINEELQVTTEKLEIAYESLEMVDLTEGALHGA